MKLLKTLLLVALMSAAVSTATHADALSGPDRTTLVRQDWGTIYHLPLSPDMRISQDIFGEWTVTRRGAQWTVKQEGHSDGYLIFFPDDKSMSVRKSEGGELTINLRGRMFYYRPGNDGWVLKTPTDEIRLSRRGKEVKISGKLGTTTVTESANGFVMTSPSGETRYGREEFDQPYKLTGVPVQSHPYVVRGMWFEAQGFGAFVDFKLADYSRAFTKLGWYPMMQVDGD